MVCFVNVIKKQNIGIKPCSTEKMFLGNLYITIWSVLCMRKWRNRSSLLGQVVQKATEFCEFCASGKRPAFIGVESERDKTEAKRG